MARHILVPSRVHGDPSSIGQSHCQFLSGNRHDPAGVAVDYAQRVAPQAEAHLVAHCHRQIDRPARCTATCLKNEIVARHPAHFAHLTPNRYAQSPHLGPALGNDRNRCSAHLQLSPPLGRRRHRTRMRCRFDQMAALPVRQNRRLRIALHDRANRTPGRGVALANDGIHHCRGGFLSQQPHSRPSANRLELAAIANADYPASALGLHLEQGPRLSGRPLPQFIDHDQRISLNRKFSGLPAPQQNICCQGRRIEIVSKLPGLPPGDRHRKNRANADLSIAIHHR